MTRIIKTTDFSPSPKNHDWGDLGRPLDSTLTFQVGYAGLRHVIWQKEFIVNGDDSGIAQDEMREFISYFLQVLYPSRDGSIKTFAWQGLNYSWYTYDGKGIVITGDQIIFMGKQAPIPL